ncbi:hypothetical protein ACLKA7_006421 [Drosophila subpalustris]
MHQYQQQQQQQQQLATCSKCSICSMQHGHRKKFDDPSSKVGYGFSGHKKLGNAIVIAIAIAIAIDFDSNFDFVVIVSHDNKSRLASLPIRDKGEKAADFNCNCIH